jgi:hypothetical protein
MPVAAKLARIERAARKEQYIHSATVLWLIAELRERMAQLTTIDARVRDVCKQIDDVLEKCGVSS